MLGYTTMTRAKGDSTAYKISTDLLTSRPWEVERKVRGEPWIPGGGRRE